MVLPVEFEVPARVEYVGLLRMLVFSLAAARRDIDDDRLDDLRLAVSEACNLVLDKGSASERRLTIVCTEDDDAFLLDVHDGRETVLPADQGGGLPEPELLDEDTDVPLALIRALVDDVSTVNQEGIEVLRLRVVCKPAPPYVRD